MISSLSIRTHISITHRTHRTHRSCSSSVLAFPRGRRRRRRVSTSICRTIVRGGVVHTSGRSMNKNTPLTSETLLAGVVVPSLVHTKGNETE